MPQDRLYDVALAADPETILQANKEVLEEELFRRRPSYLSGVETTLKSAPTSGTWEEDDWWRDALLGEWVCTAAGTPGTWKQVRPAVVDSQPSGVASGYMIIRRDSDWRLETYNGSGWDALHPLINRSASAAPGVGDDDADGYAVGSRWYDTTNGKEYVCLDPSTGAAVWKETTATGGAGSGDMTQAVYDPTNVNGDAFDRGNHTGTQTLSTISDVGTAAAWNVPASGDAGAGEVVIYTDSRLSDARTPTVHTHVLAEVTDAGTAAALDVPASGDAAAGEVVKGSDSRLTDARTPTSHGHTLSDIAGSGAAAAYDVPISGDASSTQLVKGDDSRLSDARTPTSHTHTLAQIDDAGTAAELNYPASGDAAAGEVVKGNDSRLTDSRTPTSHTHTLSDITDAGSSAALDVPSSGNAADGEVVKGSDTRLKEGAITVTIGDGVNAITSGVQAILAEMPYAGTITGWTIVADASGSIVLDVWKDTYANIPPNVADTIAGSEKPTLSSTQKNQDLTLSTWTTSLAKGDSLIFNVDSASTVKRVSLVLRITKS